MSDFTLQARQVRRTRLNICIQMADEHDFTTCWITVLGENEFVSNRSFLYVGREREVAMDSRRKSREGLENFSLRKEIQYNINILLRLYSTILFFFFFLYIKYSRYQINDHNFIEERKIPIRFSNFSKEEEQIYIYIYVSSDSTD